MFPNPVSDVLRVQIQTEGAGELTLIDMNGRQILAKTVRNEMTDLDLSEAPAGTYIMQYHNVSSVLTRQIQVLVELGKTLEKEQEARAFGSGFSFLFLLPFGHELLSHHRPEQGVMTLTFNRPEVFNSFNQEMGQAFQSALDTAATDSQVRCVVITGNGRAFARVKI